MSLKDMYSLSARILPTVCRSLARVGVIVDAQKSMGSWETDRKIVWREENLDTPLELIKTVALLSEALDCPLTRRAAKRLADTIEDEKRMALEDLANSYENLQSRLDDELEDKLIFIIPKDRAVFWDKADIVSQPVKDWSAEVAQELFLASNAYACDLHTASVFHCMRAAEQGLRLAATRLNVEISGEENWKNVIDRIQSAVRAMERLPKTPAKTAKAKYYSEIAIDAGMMKDAWRNHVAHAKVSYVERQALDVLNATRRFCEKIALPPPYEA